MSFNQKIFRMLPCCTHLHEIRVLLVIIPNTTEAAIHPHPIRSLDIATELNLISTTITMPPYSELQEPVTPTYDPANSDAKDMHNDGISPSVVAPSDLPGPPFHDSPTGATNAGERQPRRPRRRVKSMPVDSAGAQDFFGSTATSSRRYERHGSAPQAFVQSKADTLLLLQENESIEEFAEEDAAEDPTQVVSENVREDVKADAVKAEVDDTSPSPSPSVPSSSKEPVPIHQADTSCSCVIL